MFINKDTLKEFEAKMAACMPLPVKMSPSTLEGIRRFLTSQYCKRKLLDSLPELRRGETSFWCELLMLLYTCVIPSEIVWPEPSFDWLQNVFNNNHSKKNLCFRICIVLGYIFEPLYKLTLRFCYQLSGVASLIVDFCGFHVKFKFVIF